MPRIRASCSRVTHPFAGRRQMLPPALPLDLHVLSLPLAFILSQDQTLLCIFLFLSLTPDTFNSLSESTLSIFLFLGTCLYFLFQSFQRSSSNPLQARRMKRLKRLDIFPHSGLFKDLSLPLRKAGCKGSHYFLLSKFILRIF